MLNMEDSTLEVILQHKKACLCDKTHLGRKKTRGVRISLPDIATRG